MAHEIVHALQDQRWDLRTFAKDRRGETDLETALSSLFEGDATLAGLLWELADRGQPLDASALAANSAMLSKTLETAMQAAQWGLLPGTRGLRSAPLFLRKRLIRPYIDGLQLCISRSRGKHGFTGVDALYRQPPLSMEQVLHPEKIGRDFPVKLRVKGLERLTGGRLLLSDTLGELYIATVLSTFGPESRAKAAAAGWGGDRLHLIHAHGRDRLLWVTTWDAVAEAREFERALSAGAHGWRGPVVVERRERDVWVLRGWTQVKAKALIKAASGALKRRRLRKLW